MVIDINDLNFEIPDNLVLAGSDIDEFENIIYNCLKSIIMTDNIRVVVLETWLISEYFVRNALANAYHIGQYKCPELDPLYDLLPSSFNACIIMLEKLLNSQRNLPINDYDKRYTISGSPKLIYHIIKKHPDLFHKLAEVQEEFNINKGWVKRDEFISLNRRTYFGPYQNEQWVKSIDHIDKKWFEKIRKINEIRNSAAHKYDSSIIYKLMGFGGGTAFNNSKKYCLDLIYQMFSISIVK